jgi:putative membrane protein
MAIVTQYVKQPWVIVLLSALLLVAVDLVLDPVFVHLGIWIWITPGFYYGVPISNYVGWLFTGLVSAAILIILVRWRIGPAFQFPVFVAISLILILGFWSGYTLMIGLVIPFVMSVFLLGFLIWSFIKHWPTE